MEKWTGLVALVTGASSGFGAAISENLVKSGMKVVGAARRFEKMQEMEKKLKGEEGIFMPVKCDVTKDEEVYAMFDKIKNTFGGVDVCVNYAGIIGTGHDLLNGSPEVWRPMINMNVIAVCLCSKLMVESIRERGLNRGHIVNISSLAGHNVYTFNPTHFYTATKFALRAISEGLRQELKDSNSNIKVSVVNPGLVKKDVFKYVRPNSGLIEKSDSLPVFQPEDVAVTVNQILSTPSYMEVFDIMVLQRDKDSKMV